MKSEEHTYESLEQFEPIKPHSYPLIIKIGLTFCCIIFCIFLMDLPYHFKINTIIKKAEKYFQTKKYQKAIIHFASVLDKLPNNKRIKIRLAQSLFATDSQHNHDMALCYLEDITLKNEQWNEMLSYMPKEYIEHFETVRT